MDVFRLLPAVGRHMMNAMTWEELKDLLVELSEETRVASTHGIEAVALNLPPEEWFISMKFTNALGIGRYEGDELRLVGTEQIPLPELTAASCGSGWSRRWGVKCAACSTPEAVELFAREMRKRADVNRDHDLG